MYLVILRLVQKCLNILTIFFLVRSITTYDFGHYSLLLSIISILSIFSLPGLATATTQSVARGFSGTYRVCLKASSLSGLAITAFCLFMSVYYWNTDIQVSLCYLVMAICVPCIHSLGLWKSVYKGKEDFSTITKVGVFVAFCRSVLMIAGILTFNGSLLAPFSCYVVVPALANVLMTFKTLKSISSEEEEEEDGSYSYGIQTTFYGIINILANHIDKLLLFNFLSPVSLALYAAAEKIPEMSKGLIQDFGKVLAPRFARFSFFSDRIDRILSIISIALGTAIVVFSFFALPWVMSLIFGDIYDDAIPYAQWLMLSIAIGNHATMRAVFITSQLDVVGYRNYISIMSVLRIFASICLIPIFGVWGAVYATILYRVCMVITMNFVIKKYKITEDRALKKHL